MARIAIIGLGLIGASLGLALKKNSRMELSIVGVDREARHASRARQLGAVDSTVRHPAEAAEGADLVFVATPIIAVRRVFEDIAPVVRPGAIITDTASVKTAVLDAANAILPAHAHFVGGHPMAGSDRSGPDAARADLFVDEHGGGRAYCIVPGPGAAEQAVRTIVGVVEMIGARAVFIDAREHDALVAAISHMPMLVSTALFTMARDSRAWSDLAPLAGPAFHDLTRLAKGSPEMALDIIGSNRENIVHWLDRYVGELSRIRELLAGEERPLHELLLRAQADRELLDERAADRKTGEAATAPPNISDQFLAMIVGERLMQRTRDIEGAMERDPRERRLSERQKQRQLAEDEG